MNGFEICNIRALLRYWSHSANLWPLDETNDIATLQQYVKFAPYVDGNGRPSTALLDIRRLDVRAVTAANLFRLENEITSGCDIKARCHCLWWCRRNGSKTKLFVSKTDDL